jgi:hypothetical protein
VHCLLCCSFLTTTWVQIKFEIACILRTVYYTARSSVQSLAILFTHLLLSFFLINKFNALFCCCCCFCAALTLISDEMKLLITSDKREKKVNQQTVKVYLISMLEVISLIESSHNNK